MSESTRKATILGDERSGTIEIEKPSPETRPVPSNEPAYRAYRVLRFGFVVIPIVAGVDKFFSVLTHWDQYVAPIFLGGGGISLRGLTMIVGAIEIIIGFGVAISPRVFSYILAVWFGATIVNLLLLGSFYDVALGNFGLLLGAVALGRLAEQYGSLVPRRRLQAVQ